MGMGKNEAIRHLKKDSRTWLRIAKEAKKQYKSDMRLIRKLKKDRKGQFVIVPLLVSVMTILAFIVIYPIIKTAIDKAVVDMDVYSGTLLQLTPFFILLSIILTIVYLALPIRE